MSRICFLVNARNKGKYVYKAVKGALSQIVPCEILLSDQGSTDNTVDEMKRAVAECQMGADHTVRIVHCPIAGPYGMLAMNNHVSWAVQQTDAEWIFQSSADDYSMPARVSVCMEAVKNNSCSAVATTMYFEDPEKPSRDSVSGYPRQTGYVKAGEGLLNLAYGSTIGGYRRDFLEKVADKAGPNTPDVFFGILAALDSGFYAVASPQHVHSNVADIKNTGFQGRMRAASGEEALQLSETNHLQLLRLYFACWEEARNQHPNGIPAETTNALVNMILGQSKGLLDARLVLMEKGIQPGTI